MTLGTLYNDLIDEVVTQLKNITELADDAGPPVRAKVVKWFKPKRAIRGEYFAEVKAGPMTIVGGFTTKSSENSFEVIVDLVYFSLASDGFETGFNSAMSVAQKIYDQFHITNINSLVRLALVSLFPGDGELSGTLLAIPIRCVITCTRVITQ